MQTILTTLALLLTLFAALSTYLSSSNQLWLDTPWPSRRGRCIALAAILTAFLLWLQLLQPATSVFLMIALLMAFGVALPFLGALRQLLTKKR